jgi:dihydrofolate synthase/folylpolyglutamate synthase
MKYDLNNIRRLLEALGNPHVKTKFIHIAGTNGKGGTASFLASILMEHGLKTGLFTSPHILRFNERIRINGKTISDNYIKRFLDNSKKVIEEIKPSFFEVNTAIAFKYFENRKVDIAVVEAGLGGRLDSTNIITPELIIITQIGIDHTEYLGNTLKDIAKEKLGIVKPGIDVIVSDTNKNLTNIFISKIEPARLHFLDKHFTFHSIYNKSIDNKYYFKRSNKNKVNNLMLSSPLPGNYQVRNIAAALLGAEIFLENNNLEFRLRNTKKAIRNVKTNTGYRCRFEILKKDNINYILDISHNPAGIQSALNNFSSLKPDVIIFGMMNDKDYKKSIINILRTKKTIIFTQPDYKRAIPANELWKYAKSSKYGRNGVIYKTCKVSDAVKLAKQLAGKNGNVLIIGSFFLISEAIKNLRIQKLFR